MDTIRSITRETMQLEWNTNAAFSENRLFKIAKVLQVVKSVDHIAEKYINIKSEERRVAFYDA